MIFFAQDSKQRIIVDIQHARTDDHYDRFLYYHSIALLEQIAKAENYRAPLKVFTIVVLTSGDRHQTPIAVTDFDPHNLDGKPLHEIPYKIIYLCPKYVTGITPEPHPEWLRAIDDTLDEKVDETQYQQTAIHKLFDAIRRDHISPEERANMIDEFHLEELQQTKLAEGKIIRQREIACALLGKGIAADIIAETTGLSLELTLLTKEA